MKTALTVGGFIAAAILAAMAAILVGALNLILNGYHPECGIWRNVVPFACTPGKQSAAPPPADRRLARLPAPPSKPAFKAPAAPQKAAARPKPPNNPYTGRREPWGCAPLQQEPYRVQCTPQGICYHDPGFRAECGLAHNWNDGW